MTAWAGMAVMLWTATVPPPGGGHTTGPWRAAAAHEARVDTAGVALMRALSCGACHGGAPQPAPSTAAPALGPDMTRYAAAWVFAYLAGAANPAGAQRGAASGPARMPDFGLDEGERLALALFLGRATTSAGSGPAGGSGRTPTAPLRAASPQQEEALRQARSRHPDVDAALGRRIFVGLDCAACHRYPGIEAWRSGPPLNVEKDRVRGDWLRAYLKAPRPVRPFGFQPGTGSRMPDYHLSTEEVDALATALGPTKSLRDGAIEAQDTAPLSPYDQVKIEVLLRKRLACLGCHRLDGVGGRVGPDLSAAGSRLQPGFIRRMISDPQHTVPGSAMPEVPMPSGTEALLVRLLAGRHRPAPPATRLSLAATELQPPERGDTAASVYLRFCSSCHGAGGGGDGYNVPNLPVPPTVHASAAVMSPLPDDVIYDAIASGGHVMGRSARMPPFGATLDDTQIRGLVAHIRTLCRCKGPAWSTDGAGGSRRAPGEG